ncbi:MAG: hypothetical protein LBE12_10260 [Planctomycetaceae bacterium]|nr:hypothetical protein [Planctomycetaceae bacterium]
MNTAGKIVIKKEKTKILKNGKLAVYNNKGHCYECCQCCKPKTIATFTVPQNENTNRVWDLTPYQGDGIVAQDCPGQYWRLRNNYMGYVPERKGCVDENGKIPSILNFPQNSERGNLINFIVVGKLTEILFSKVPTV